MTSEDLYPVGTKLAWPQPLPSPNPSYTHSLVLAPPSLPSPTSPSQMAIS